MESSQNLANMYRQNFKKIPQYVGLHQAWDQKVRFCLDWSSGLQKNQIGQSGLKNSQFHSDYLKTALR